MFSRSVLVIAKLVVEAASINVEMQFSRQALVGTAVEQLCAMAGLQSDQLEKIIAQGRDVPADDCRPLDDVVGDADSVTFKGTLALKEIETLPMTPPTDDKQTPTSDPPSVRPCYPLQQLVAKSLVGRLLHVLYADREPDRRLAALCDQFSDVAFCVMLPSSRSLQQQTIARLTQFGFGDTAGFSDADWTQAHPSVRVLGWHKQHLAAFDAFIAKAKQEPDMVIGVLSFLRCCLIFAFFLQHSCL